MRVTRLLALLTVVLALCGASAIADPFALHSGDRVVTYGDSITAQQLYSNYAEAFVLTRFPKLTIDWWTAGWGGDRVTGGGGGNIDTRLSRDVLAFKPTRVTIMLGMNDGGYRPLDEALFNTYQKGYQHILDSIKKADPSTKVTLILPSPYDDVTQTPKFDGGYNAVLVKYGEYVNGLAQSQGLDTADFNSAVVAMLQKAKATDPELAKKIIPDRVHPSPAGHLVMAETLVRSWNFPSLVSAVSIDASAATAVRADGATVSKLKGGESVSWDELEAALPLPINFDDPLTALVLNSSDVVDAIDQETLQVTGLTAAKYELRIDDKAVGTFAKEDLAAGVNLATYATPMLAQALTVRDLTASHVGVHATRFRSILAPYQGDTDPNVKKALGDVVSALDKLDEAFVAKQRAAAQPVLHHFALAAAQ